MTVYVYFPPGTDLYVFMQDGKCEACGKKVDFSFDENEEGTFTPLDSMPKSSCAVNVHLETCSCKNDDDEKCEKCANERDYFNMSINDYIHSESEISLRIDRINNEPAKIYVEYNEKFYEFSERTWTSKVNEKLLDRDVGRYNFNIKIIRKIPKISNFDKIDSYSGEEEDEEYEEDEEEEE